MIIKLVHIGFLFCIVIILLLASCKEEPETIIKN